LDRKNSSITQKWGQKSQFMVLKIAFLGLILAAKSCQFKPQMHTSNQKKGRPRAAFFFMKYQFD